MADYALKYLAHYFLGRFYLFLCPGKREAPGPHLDALAEPTEEFAARFRQTLRNPIYVHSKMLIVDDSYIIGTG